MQQLIKRSWYFETPNLIFMVIIASSLPLGNFWVGKAAIFSFGAMVIMLAFSRLLIISTKVIGQEIRLPIFLVFSVMVVSIVYQFTHSLADELFVYSIMMIIILVFVISYLEAFVYSVLLSRTLLRSLASTLTVVLTTLLVRFIAYLLTGRMIVADLFFEVSPPYSLFMPIWHSLIGSFLILSLILALIHLVMKKN